MTSRCAALLMLIRYLWAYLSVVEDVQVPSGIGISIKNDVYKDTHFYFVMNNIEKWKLNNLIKKLENAHGFGTSMVTLILRAGSQLAQASVLLTEEFGTAGNIKSRVNRQSVLAAITSAQYIVKLYTRVPKNGLAIFCGTINDDGKEKKVSIHIEPPLPVNAPLYKCDCKFHVDLLKNLLADSEKYGFIIIDGNGCLYGTVSGSRKEVITKFSVDLPKKQRKGGQSAQRFGRIRLELRHNYIHKVCEQATRVFISNDVPNVAGLIVAGSAEFKTILEKSELLDKRLRAVIIATLTVGYGGEHGFDEAVSQSTGVLNNV